MFYDNDHDSGIDCKICERTHSGKDNYIYISYNVEKKRGFVNCTHDKARNGKMFSLGNIPKIINIEE
jgi:hypothetical protein